MSGFNATLKVEKNKEKIKFCSTFNVALKPEFLVSMLHRNLKRLKLKKFTLDTCI